MTHIVSCLILLFYSNQNTDIWHNHALQIFLSKGIGSKMGAIYGTGFNTYYWYDMVTNIPNAYFVEVGIYKYVSSPTYTLGKHN